MCLWAHFLTRLKKKKRTADDLIGLLGRANEKRIPKWWAEIVNPQWLSPVISAVTGTKHNKTRTGTWVWFRKDALYAFHSLGWNNKGAELGFMLTGWFSLCLWKTVEGFYHSFIIANKQHLGEDHIKVRIKARKDTFSLKHVSIYIRMFTAGLFVTAPNWKQRQVHHPLIHWKTTQPWE